MVSVILWEMQIIIYICFISYVLLFKNFTDLQQILEIKKNFALVKKPQC